MTTLQRIHRSKTLPELRKLLADADREPLRALLLEEYERLYAYRDLEQWNQLVRVCEALAIIGWGKAEAVEATAERWVNGGMYTKLRTRTFEALRGHGNSGEQTECEWTKRRGRLVLTDSDETTTTKPGAKGAQTLASQRNPLPKNPLRLGLTGGRGHGAQRFQDSLAALRARLDRELAVEGYGDGFGYVGFGCTFTHEGHDGMAGWEYFHDQASVPKGLRGKYYIRPRLDFGKLAKKEGELRWVVTRHFTRQEEALPLKQQKKLFKEDLAALLTELERRLSAKRLDFDVARLRSDAARVLAEW